MHDVYQERNGRNAEGCGALVGAAGSMAASAGFHRRLYNTGQRCCYKLVYLCKQCTVCIVDIADCKPLLSLCSSCHLGCIHPAHSHALCSRFKVNVHQQELSLPCVLVT